MEGADPRAPELTAAAPPAGPREPDRSAAAGPGAALPVALSLLLLVLLGVVGWLVHDAGLARAREDARQAALHAARQQAVNLTTISYTSADRDLARIIAAATGTLKTQFQAQQSQFPAVLAREKSVSTGTVLAAGVVAQSSSSVEALLAVDASVSNAASGAAGALVKHYRMDMRLVEVHGRWLVSQVAFAGLPQ